MRKAMLAGVLGLLLSAGLYSCKKGDSSSVRAQMLQGNWKIVEEGPDADNDGQWDTSERQSVPAAEQQSLTFQSDGSGSSTIIDSGVPSTFHLNWRFQNNETEVLIMADFFGTLDTSTMSIISFTNSDLVTRVNNGNGGQYSFAALKKQ